MQELSLKIFLVGLISKYFSLCRNFHSKAGVGVNSDMGVISEEYGSSTHHSTQIMLGPQLTLKQPRFLWELQKWVTRRESLSYLLPSYECHPTYRNKKMNTGCKHTAHGQREILASIKFGEWLLTFGDLLINIITSNSTHSRTRRGQLEFKFGGF